MDQKKPQVPSEPSKPVILRPILSNAEEWLPPKDKGASDKR